MSAESVSRRLRTTDLAYIALFSVLIAVCAWISIPAPVPFTLQTFGIFAALTILGGRRGFTPWQYICCWGWRAFRYSPDSRAEPERSLGVTGGYILGFGASALVYWLVTTRLGTALPVSILACVLGLVVCYAFGTAWFWWLTPVPPVLSVLRQPWVCVLPFVVPDLIKLAPGSPPQPPGGKVSPVTGLQIACRTPAAAIKMTHDK